MRDFVSVHDVVEANLLAMERSEGDGLALNIGSGEPVSIRQVAEMLAATLGVPTTVEITGKYRAGDIRHCFADISLARPPAGLPAATSAGGRDGRAGGVAALAIGGGPGGGGAEEFGFLWADGVKKVVATSHAHPDHCGHGGRRLELHAGAGHGTGAARGPGDAGELRRNARGGAERMAGRTRRRAISPDRLSPGVDAGCGARSGRIGAIPAQRDSGCASPTCCI